MHSTLEVFLSTLSLDLKLVFCLSFTRLTHIHLLQVSSENSGRGDSRPILKLQTRLRRGKISYDSADVEIWDQTWRPPHSEVVKLEREWGSTPEAYLKIFAGENGTMCRAEVIPRSSLWDYCWPS